MKRLLADAAAAEGPLELEAVTTVPCLAHAAAIIAQMRARGWKERGAASVDAFCRRGEAEHRLSFALPCFAADVADGAPEASTIVKERIGVASVCRGVRLRLAREVEHGGASAHSEFHFFRRKLRRSFSRHSDGTKVEVTVVGASRQPDDRAPPISYEVEVEFLGAPRAGAVRDLVRALLAPLAAS